MAEKKRAEEMLLKLLEAYKFDKNMQANVLQIYIREYGPVSNEIGDKVRELMK